MKLSEAIILGSLVTKPGRGQGSLLGLNDEFCALGAAFYVSGLSSNISEFDAYDRLAIKFPLADKIVNLPCPVDGCEASRPVLAIARIIRNMMVRSIIIHLNDGHKWTRERIADWVASIEPQEADDEEMARRESVDDETLETGVVKA